MKESAVYADFEIISETRQDECAVGGCIWVDTVARHAVSGKTVYACIEPFAGTGQQDALDRALEHARDSLKLQLGSR